MLLFLEICKMTVHEKMIFGCKILMIRRMNFDDKSYHALFTRHVKHEFKVDAQKQHVIWSIFCHNLFAR